MYLIELNPVDSRKSFYGKCHVYQSNGRYVLRSYNSDVAEFDPITATVVRYVHGCLYTSRTSTRHFNAFLAFCRSLESSHPLTIVEK